MTLKRCDWEVCKPRNLTTRPRMMLCVLPPSARNVRLWVEIVPLIYKVPVFELSINACKLVCGLSSISEGMLMLLDYPKAENQLRTVLCLRKVKKSQVSRLLDVSSYSIYFYTCVLVHISHHMHNKGLYPAICISMGDRCLNGRADYCLRKS